MKRVRIYPYKIGLVFRNGNFVKALTEGVHWVWFTDLVRLYDMTQEFIEPCELNILMEDEDLNRLLKVVEVADNEIVIQFENGNFKQVLGPGRYAFWDSIMDFEFKRYNINELEVSEEIDRKLLMKRELLSYIRVFTVKANGEGLLMVDGKFVRKVEPGTYYFWKNEKNAAILEADLRLKQMEISGQEILTKDKAALRINFFIQYKVADVEKALLENKDFEKQIYILMQLALREYVGTLTLDELLAKKEEVKDFVLKEVKEAAEGLGIRLINCGIRDVILPGEVKDILNQVLIAEKKAQANTITRREETASTRSLLNTAKLMEENTMLFKLKELEYVEKLAEKINSITVSGGGQVLEQMRQIFLRNE